MFCIGSSLIELRFGWFYFAGKILRNVSAMGDRGLVVPVIAMTGE
jgi:hypothetical protein